jgi:hypothetical protein
MRHPFAPYGTNMAKVLVHTSTSARVERYYHIFKYLYRYGIVQSYSNTIDTCTVPKYTYYRKLCRKKLYIDSIYANTYLINKYMLETMCESII